MNSILIVDDDKEIVDLVKLYLQNEGYTIYQAYNGREALEIIQKERLSLIILDVMLPEMNGLEVCRKMRKAHIFTPILMLSAKAEDDDKIKGLLTGADDYLVKPFNPLELSVRVKVILRRMQNRQESEELLTEQIMIGPIVIDKAQHSVTVNQQELHLTTSEFDILTLLASHPGKVFSSELIFEKIWHEQPLGTSKTVMVHISNLRDKLRLVSGGETIIKTIWGVGYKIEA